MDPKELREKRARLIGQARELLDRAGAENRDLDTEEEAQYDKMLDDANKLKARIEREEGQLEEERDLATSQGTVAGQQDSDPSTAPGGAQDPESRGNAGAGQAEERRTVMFNSYLRHGPLGMDQAEYRALQADSDEAGGYLVAPQRFVNSIIKGVDDAVFFRGLATKQTITNAESLGVPSLDADPSDADWTPEIGTVNEDSTMDFGKRELNPHLATKLIKVSEKLLRRSVMDVESLVRDRFIYKFGVTQEKAFLTGSGSQQPLGVFTSSTNGISTGRDVSSGNTTTSMQFDGLKDCKYSVKGQYWPRLRWIFHRDGVKQVSKMKDGEGQYIWSDSVRVGEPDRLLNFPVMMSEYAPNTFTTGQYVGILGDFSFYWIADALSMRIQRLMELYTANNQVGFKGQLETDGMPVLEEAFARVTLA